MIGIKIAKELIVNATAKFHSTALIKE